MDPPSPLSGNLHFADAKTITYPGLVPIHPLQLTVSVPPRIWYRRLLEIPICADQHMALPSTLGGTFCVSKVGSSCLRSVRRPLLRLVPMMPANKPITLNTTPLYAKLTRRFEAGKPASNMLPPGGWGVVIGGGGQQKQSIHSFKSVML